KGIMAMVGRGAAVAELGPARRTLHGPLAFVSWLGVHATMLSGAWQRTGAIASWSIAFLPNRRPQVVLGQAEKSSRLGEWQPSSRSRGAPPRRGEAPGSAGHG